MIEWIQNKLEACPYDKIVQCLSQKLASSLTNPVKRQWSRVSITGAR